MPLPKECKMPDLSHLAQKKVLGLYLLSGLIGSDNNLSKKFILYRKVFVRLADKAVYEYSMAREAIIDQINNKDGGIYIAPIINHLENYINTVRRLYYLFDRIKSKKQGLFFIDKNLRKSIDSQLSQIKDIRNLVEHIDGAISKGEIKDGQTIALDLSEDASEIRIGELKLSTETLANIIECFYEIAAELAIYNAPGVSEENFNILKLKNLINNNHTLANKKNRMANPLYLKP